MCILGIKVGINLKYYTRQILIQISNTSLFLGQENIDKQKQFEGDDEVYVLLIQQLLKPDNEGVLTGKILIRIVLCLF